MSDADRGRWVVTGMATICVATGSWMLAGAGGVLLALGIEILAFVLVELHRRLQP